MYVCILYQVELQYIANSCKSTLEGPQTQLHHGIRRFTRHHWPQDGWIIRSYSAYILRLSICTGWVLETSPSDHYWRRYVVGQWWFFCWFWSWRTFYTQLVRRKLGKKTHPNHGGHRRPTAAMVPFSRHRDIWQSANMLRDKSMLLKIENIFVITIY